MEYVQNNYGHARSCSGNSDTSWTGSDIINQPRIRTEANGINNKGVADILGEGSYQVTGRLTSEGEGLGGADHKFYLEHGKFRC